MKILKLDIVWFLSALFSVGLILTPLHGYGQDTPSLDETIEQARSAGMDAEQIEELQNRATSRGVAEEQLSEVLRLAIEMREQNLPEQMILGKAMEGLSKGIPPDQLLSVLNNIGNQAGEAASVIDPWMERSDVQGAFGQAEGGPEAVANFRQKMIEASSKALSQGFRPGELSALLDDISDEALTNRENTQRVVTAVTILPDLPNSSDQPATSRALVMRAMKGGFGAGELQRLPAALNAAQMRGGLPASAVLEGVARQMDEGTPAQEILQNLFNGNPGTGGMPGNRPPGLDNRPDDSNRGGNNNQGGNN